MMCGEGCIRKISRITLSAPRKEKIGERTFRACLIEKSGEQPMIAPNGCSAAFDLGQFLKKTGARIIES